VWDIIVDDIVEAVCEFFTNGKNLKALNHTIIALIPKELMHNYYLDRGPFRCAFNVDIQKAYDTVDSALMDLFMVILKGNVVFVKGLVNLCFADDLFLFVHGDVDSDKVIKEALEEFKNASGLISSLAKSTAYFCNVLNHVMLSILHILPFGEGRLPMKYLGVHLVSSRLMFRDCKELIEKLESRVRDWKKKCLSAAGRLQLAQSVLGSMHIYWASVFILPTRALHDIE
nr:reverse transcriptase domain, reverse transcriptase zinc-binding domain protein [Tanacetum cinerariifolium]